MTVDWQLADSRDVRRMDTWQKGRAENEGKAENLLQAAEGVEEKGG